MEGLEALGANHCSSDSEVCKATSLIIRSTIKRTCYPQSIGSKRKNGPRFNSSRIFAHAAFRRAQLKANSKDTAKFDIVGDAIGEYVVQFTGKKMTI